MRSCKDVVRYARAQKYANGTNTHFYYEFLILNAPDNEGALGSLRW